MTAIISQAQQDILAEQNAQIALVGKAFDAQFKYAKESMKSASKILSAQQSQMHESLKPAIEAVNSVKAFQASLPDFSETLKALELAKKSAVINVDIFPSTGRRSYQGVLSPEPQVRRREPKLSAEEVAFVKELMDKKESQSIELIAEQVTSVFNWNTFDLHIEGQRIKLEATEKLICMCVFRNPKTRCMELDTVERTVYGEIVPDSKRLKQAIKRINAKIRLAGFDNIFSCKEGFLNIKI